MANFETAYLVVKRNEGGWANNPNDRGGETYKGIARNFHPRWSGWPIIDAYRKHAKFEAALEKDAILQKLVRAFYKENYWNALSLDYVAHQETATELFDTGVNMGTGVAGIFLQTALNVNNKNGKEYPDLKMDGKVGPVTIQTLNAHKRPMEILKLLNIQQGAKYIDICMANPSQEIFMTSWLSRVSL